MKYDIQKHGYRFECVNKDSGATFYIKRLSDEMYINVFVLDYIVSIDLVINGKRNPIAVRYKISSQRQLDFLLTKSTRLI